MNLQPVNAIVFPFLSAKPIHFELSSAAMSSDAGLLPIRQLDEQLQFTANFAAAILDERNPGAVCQSVLSMVRQRIYGILADYEDQNDHDVLRSDPVFKLIADRLPTEADLASQPTLSRFENSVKIPDLWRLRDALFEQFVKACPARPARITLDVDPVDDPAHGHQQLTLFHGFYDQNQYLPIIVTSAETDLVLLVGLRHGTASASLGVDDDLRYLVQRIRAKWPDVEIHVRGDSGFGVPLMYEICEQLNVQYTFGLRSNARLQNMSEELLATAVADYAKTGVPQRLFMGAWYQADSWSRPRWVIIKAEAHAQGTNRRVIVTNRPGAEVLPNAAYEDYAARGEAENRNKELKAGLHMDRLSDHRFMANFFRLYLHAAAMNLLVFIRRTLTPETLRPIEVGMADRLPAEALDEPRRKAYFNRRRHHDPLGGGQPCTWRTRLIKVAAEIVVSARRVLVRLSSSWPYLPHFQSISQAVLQLATKTT